MAKRNDSSCLAWFVAGMTVGIAATVLLAPQSGEEMRRSLANAAARGRDYADRKGREAMDFGKDVFEQGKEVLEHGREWAEDAKEAGKETIEKGKKALADLTSHERKAEGEEA